MTALEVLNYIKDNNLDIPIEQFVLELWQRGELERYWYSEERYW